MSKNKFNIIYNQWLRQLDVGDEDLMWKEIENELDFNETWGNISAHLDVVQPERKVIIGLPPLKVFLAAAAIILLLIIPANYNYDILPDLSTIRSSLVAKVEGPEPGNDSNVIADDEFPNKAQDDLKEAVSSQQFYQMDIAGLPEEKTNAEPYIFTSASQEDKLNLDMIPMREWDGNNNNVTNLKPMLAYAELQPEEENRGRARSPFQLAEAGLVFGYKNTWLWNSETANGLNPQSLRNTLLTFHHDIGFTSTIEYKNKHRIGLQFLWKSGTGQNYQQYINASYVDRNIKLNYFKLQGFYVFETKRVPGQVLIGSYFARLNLAEEYRDGNRVNLKDNFRNSDYGLLLGYQFEVSVLNRILLKPRIITSYNLMNIARENELSPAGMNRTRNFTTGFDLAIYYRLSR